MDALKQFIKVGVGNLYLLQFPVGKLAKAQSEVAVEVVSSKGEEIKFPKGGVPLLDFPIFPRTHTAC